MFRLEKKIAFVTGAGSGIGESIARLFAQQGAHVVLADVREDAAQRVAAEIQEAGGSARIQALDVAEESQVKASIEQVATAEGRLDILVNNAGISHVGSILETSLEDWERTMRVNALCRGLPGLQLRRTRGRGTPAIARAPAHGAYGATG